MLNYLHNKLAKPDDIFVVNFGVWHTKEGPNGMDNYRRALKGLGEFYTVRMRAAAAGAIEQARLRSPLPRPCPTRATPLPNECTHTP